jgi:hypothetical protein
VPFFSLGKELFFFRHILVEPERPYFVPTAQVMHSPITQMKRVKFEDQPWYAVWKKSLDRVVATRLARDAIKPSTPEWEAADLEYQNALTAHRLLADQLL